jgi:hypothetical protein
MSASAGTIAGGLISIEDDSVAITGCVWLAADVVVPPVIEGLPVRAIGVLSIPFFRTSASPLG